MGVCVHSPADSASSSFPYGKSQPISKPSDVFVKLLQQTYPDEDCAHVGLLKKTQETKFSISARNEMAHKKNILWHLYHICIAMLKVAFRKPVIIMNRLLPSPNYSAESQKTGSMNHSVCIVDGYLCKLSQYRLG